MAKLDIDFVHRRHVPWGGLLLMLVAAVWCGGVFVHWLQLRAQDQAGMERVSTLELALKERQRDIAEIQIKVEPRVRERLKEYGKIAVALNYPWNRVLAEIDLPGAPHVALLSFVHDQGVGDIRLTVEALDVATLTELVDQLNADGTGAPWLIEDYQAQPQNSPPSVKAGIVKRKGVL